MKFDKDKIKQFIQDYRAKTIEFFHSERFRRISIFMFFLFLAFCFWLSKTFRDDFSYNYRIPVAVINLPPETAILNNIPEYIQVSVNAKGYDVFRYNHKAHFDSIVIDLSDIQINQNSYTLTSDELSNEIKKQLYNDTRLISLYPSHIQFNFALKASKQVPVKLNGNIILSSQFQRIISGDIVISPNVVTAYGPKGVIDTLKFVPTAFFEEKDLLDTLRREAVLQSIMGVQFVPDKVSVFIPVEQYTEKVIQVPVTALNEPADISLRTFPMQVSVSFTVQLSKYESITNDDFEVSVDYLEFEKNDEQEKHQLYLSKFPDFVQNVRITPSEVGIVLEEKATEKND